MCSRSPRARSPHGGCEALARRREPQRALLFRRLNFHIDLGRLAGYVAAHKYEDQYADGNDQPTHDEIQGQDLSLRHKRQSVAQGSQSSCRTGLRTLATDREEATPWNRRDPESLRYDCTLGNLCRSRNTLHSRLSAELRSVVQDTPDLCG